MKKLSNFLLFISLLFISSESVAQNIPTAGTWPRGITYEIFVQSFADSDGDGIGDINGMTSKLDYLQDLGIQGIWLMPINPSQSYHKYDVSDYYDIHPDYGTLEDFKEFVQEAHKRNIHVVMDLVINHSGRDNVWFLEALKDKTSKYWGFYVWTHKDDPQVKPAVSTSENGTPRRRRSNWNMVEGSDYQYFAHFSRNMPDLNYDNPLLQQEIFTVGKFWLSEVGVDGFRLDAARHIYPDNRATDNHKWWEYFLQEMKKVKEDVYIVGEVWAPSDVVAPYLKGIPALFNFDMGGAIIQAVNEEKGGPLVETHKEIEDFYKNVNPDFVDATFLTNHDQNRILNSVGKNIEKAKMAAALLLTLPGSPYIYYGEEIGMLGEKPDPYIREPFIWDKKENDAFRTTWEQPRNSTESAVVPLSAQQADENSLFNHYKDFIHFRNQSSALTFGDLIPVNIENPSICAFIRSDSQESLFVMHNLSPNELTISIPSDLGSYESIVFSNKSTKKDNNQVKISGYSTVIFK
ncbi:alpha-amylase family glycosyl hydrolase [Candidatus Latescibacterota bacterium]